MSYVVSISYWINTFSLCIQWVGKQVVDYCRDARYTCLAFKVPVEGSQKMNSLKHSEYFIFRLATIKIIAQ